MKIENHWLLGGNTLHVPSPNFGDLFSEGLPDTIIFHYTALETAEEAVEHLCNPVNEVSAHVVVARSLEIFQLVPFNTIAWHAGESSWGERFSLNRYSIGVEVDNAGKLDFVNGRYLSWFGKEYPENEVLEVRNDSGELEYWHSFKPEQIQRIESLIEQLLIYYPIDTFLSHSEVAPERKVDPGPAFPLEELRDKFLG